jgi:hypothetical protein
MFRRASTLMITLLLATLTTAAPAVAGGTGSDSGGTVSTLLGDFHCC